MRFLLIKIFSLFFLLSLTSFSFSQNFDAGFEKYNKKRLGPYTTYWHEFLICSSFAMDLDYKTSIQGNLGIGLNYGIGAGYLIKLGLDDKPQNLGLGFKAEYYPNAFYKFNAQFDAKLLALGYQHWFASFLGGGEFNVTFDIPFERREFHTILYMLDIQFGTLELKWGLQSWYDKFKNSPYFDFTFNSFKLTYKIRR